MTDSYLFDKDFLVKLDTNRNKQIYARIFALTLNEDTIEEITGIVTGGSINIDGISAVRRTCSLTMAASMEDEVYHEAVWGINHKFKLEIGVQNTIDNRYPEICWFKQGTFLTTSFSCSLNTTAYTINISGKDKMSLLNGDIGGKIPATADDFSVLETQEEQFTQVSINQTDYIPGKYYLKRVDDQYTLSWEENFSNKKIYYDRDIVTTTKKIPIYEIIQQLVHMYGNEPYENIIINDLDEMGYELLEYRGKDPLYIIQRANADTYKGNVSQTAIEYSNITTNKDMICYKIKNPNNFSINEYGNLTLIQGNKEDAFELTTLENIESTPLANSLLDFTEVGDRFCLANPQSSGQQFTAYLVSKINYGETVGYSLTDLVYAGELKVNIGETVIGVLDKIIKQLVGFEYFYDLNGRFIFQKKPYSMEQGINNNPLRQDVLKGTFSVQEDLVYKLPYEYNFQDNLMISAFSNSANLSNLKNDFIVWGKRKTSGGVDIPIHMRVAFDEKPYYYKTIKLSFKQKQSIITDFHNPALFEQIVKQERYAESHNIKTAGKVFTTENYDWREILYQMARDYYLYRDLEFFNELVEENNIFIDDNGNTINLYPNGITGYEQYYIDIYSFWRELYNPNPELVISMSDKKIEQNNQILNIDGVLDNSKLKNQNIISGVNAINVDCNYYLNYDSFNDIKNGFYLYKPIPYLFHKDQVKNLFFTDDEKNKKYRYWNKNIFLAPYLLNFWFDFYEHGDISKYSVRAIGDRIQVTNNDKIKAIYYSEVPNLIFMTHDDYKKLSNNLRRSNLYRYFFLSEASKDLFSISSKTLNAKDSIFDAINNNSYITENVTITALPVYYLEPNHCIQVVDETTHINGLYNLTKISIPLTYNGTMSLTVAKINLQQ